MLRLLLALPFVALACAAHAESPAALRVLTYNIRFDNPPSADVSDAEANAFSISSTHKIVGAIAWACDRARRSWLSLSPMYF